MTPPSPPKGTYPPLPEKPPVNKVKPPPPTRRAPVATTDNSLGISKSSLSVVSN